MTDKSKTDASTPGAESAEAATLRARLRAYIRAQFGDLPSRELAAALSDCADEFRNTAPTKPTGSTLAYRSDFTEAPTKQYRQLRSLSDALVPAQTTLDGKTPYVLLRAANRDDVALLLYQAIEVGAIVLALKEKLALNDLINIELTLVDAQFSIRTQAKVVHISAAGTAVEVSRIDREDRIALQGILEDHRGDLQRLRTAIANAAHRQGAGQSEPSGAARMREATVSSARMTAAMRQQTMHAPFPNQPTPSGETLQPGEHDGVAGGEGDMGQPNASESEMAPSVAAPQGPVGSIFARNKRPSSSVTLGALNRYDAPQDFSSRREVELIDPDLRVMTLSGRVLQPGLKAGDTQQLGSLPVLDDGPLAADSSTLFGPDLPWLEPIGSPARVEELTGERIVDVLLQLSGSGFSGLAEVAAEGIARQIYFEGGLVVEIRRCPRLSSEDLGPMLHMADHIDAQQLAMAAAHAEENHTIFERSLLELELLDQDHIRQAISGRLTFLLRAICEIDRGQITVFNSQAMPAGYLPAPPLRVHVPVERIIYKRLFERLKMIDAEQRAAMVAGHLDAYPEVAPDGYERLERVVLSPAHTRLVQRILGERRRLREVFTESSLSPSETAAVVHALHRMGVLRFDTSLHKTIVRERFRENVTVKFLSVHKASFFEVLNVHWSSYDEMIDKAYQELSVQFDPSAIPESMEAEVVERVREIHERVERAYQTLSDHAQRQAYRKRIMPAYKLAHAIPLFMKQSELAERRSEGDEAIDSLRRVLEIDPGSEKAGLYLLGIEQMQAGRLSSDPAKSSF